MCICQSWSSNLSLPPLPPGNHKFVFYIWRTLIFKLAYLGWTWINNGAGNRRYKWPRKLLCWHTLSSIPKTLINNADVWGEMPYLWGLLCYEIGLRRIEKNRIWTQAANQDHRTRFLKVSMLDTTPWDSHLIVLKKSLASVVFQNLHPGDYNMQSRLRTLGTKSILTPPPCH